MIKPRKVLYVIDTLEIGGAERSLLDILARMDVFEPTICFIYRGNSLEEKYREAGICVLGLGLDKKYGFLTAVRLLVRLMRRIKPDLVVTTLFRSDIAGRIAARLCGVPVLSCFVSDTYAPVRLAAMTSIGRFKHRLLWVLDYFTSRLCAGFIANSAAVADSNSLALGLHRNRIDVIYRGRDRKVFHPPTRKYRLATESGPRLICVARMEVTKRQMRILQVFTRVLDIYPSATLQFAGDGPERERMEAEVRRLGVNGAVDILGTRTDIADLLRNSDLFISASDYEGLPGAVIEAMLCGVPVMLSDIDVHREMIQDGVQGRLFDASVDFSPIICEILSRPAEASRRAALALEAALERFEIQTVAEQHELLYKRLLSGESPESFKSI